MSHSLVVVLINPEEMDIEEAVARALEPFNENTDVPEYDKGCHCIGTLARQAAQEQATRAVASVETLRQTFWAGREKQKKDADPDAVDEAWETYIKPYQKAYDAAFSSHPLKDEPDPKCESCHGTGTYRTTYNPKSRWDWYAIGGRWDGHVPHNRCIVRELPQGFSCFAILTPDGEWHERGQMGWWGVVGDEKESRDWDKERSEVLSTYPGHLAIGVDVHI